MRSVCGILLRVLTEIENGESDRIEVNARPVFRSQVVQANHKFCLSVHVRRLSLRVTNPAVSEHCQQHPRQMYFRPTYEISRIRWSRRSIAPTSDFALLWSTNCRSRADFYTTIIASTTMAVRLSSREDYAGLLDKYDTWLFDCDGVLWQGDKLIDGATDVLQLLRHHSASLILI